MSKREDLASKISPILNNKEKIEQFIITNSNLPGPRGNLELAFALAEVYENLEVILEWLKITDEIADVNNPRSFLPFCAAVCLGKFYLKDKNPELIFYLKQMSLDKRWRIREAVAFAFQIIGEQNFDMIKIIFSIWIMQSNNLEKRAILAALAHPNMLNEKNVKFCFEISDKVLNEMDVNLDFEVLQKGLSYAISVFVAANSSLGFQFIEKWMNKSKIINKILLNNLKKKRLLKLDAEKVENLYNRLRVL